MTGVKWIGHHMRHREVYIKFNIISKEPLRIGSGREVKLTSPVDLPVLKVIVDGVEKPYIPGSSIKGIFRSFMDVFIRSYNGYTCPGSGNNVCYSLGGIKSTVENLVKQANYLELVNVLWRNLCLSCKVYGSGSYRSKVIFYDFMPIGEAKLGVKPGIAIDRKTGATARGAFYQVEFVQPGAVFSGGLRAYDVPNYVLGIIGLTLMEINEGRIKIGGFKTRGFGRVEIRDLEIEVIFHTNISGKVEDGKLVLNPMDHIDVQVDYSLPAKPGTNNMVRLSGDDAWNLINTITSRTIMIDDIVKKIVDEHKPEWLGEPGFV
ncbi:MAG: CRISPR-associated RAMP protein [Thermoprotei archaeon]|nr:MAG: CRISPR-associated RAMP protein [Thermoprotei archaeon]